MDKNIQLQPNDLVQETRLKIDETLKVLPTLSKNEAKEVYENTVNMCLYEDLMSTFKGRAITEMYGREMATKIAKSAAENYLELTQDGITLELTEEHKKQLKDFVDDLNGIDL